MRKMRALIKKYERWVMLALVILLLVIFTVTGQIAQVLKGAEAGQYDPRAVAGSFAVLPGDRVEVTFERFEAARRTLQLVAMFGNKSPDKVRDSEVWTYLLLSRAAERDGIVISDQELDRSLRRMLSPYIYDNVSDYKGWIKARFRISPRQFEEAIRDVLTAARVREIYSQSFRYAPPATRKEMLDKYASQALEYARVSYAALDAGHFVTEAARELDAEPEADKKLREFFEKDPALQADRKAFRHPRRYVVEFLYTLHKTLDTPRAYERIEKLFQRTYPSLDVSKLEPNVKAMRDFFGIYRDRLLNQLGTDWEEVKEDERKAHEDDGREEPAPEDGNGGDEEEGGAGDEGDVPPPVDPELRKAWFERGFEIVKEQVDRELRVRGMYQWFRDEAAKTPRKSLRELFERLKKNDDPEHPVCSDHTGEGLIVYLEFPEGITGDGIEEITDRDVKFTHNTRARVTQIGDTDLPRLYKKADTMGMSGDGRMIIRLLEVKEERRKTFEELTPADRRDLRERYYLPHRAREKAREALEKLRKRFVDGELEASGFGKAAQAYPGGFARCRVHENEWITASYDYMAEPDKNAFWPAEYQHMRDRHFLRQRLASILGADRVEPKLEAGSFLEVVVDARDDAEDAGAAYLVLLLERRKPGPETMPPSELSDFLGAARSRRQAEENARWSTQIRQLFSDFDMQFEGEMDKRIKDELAKLDASRRR